VLCNGIIKDSLCKTCYDCRPKLLSIDSNYSIVSFKIVAGGEGFEGYTEEAANFGNSFENTEVRRIITKLRTGSFIEFNCIKAKDRNGKTFVLQPLLIQL